MVWVFGVWAWVAAGLALITLGASERLVFGAAFLLANVLVLQIATLRREQRQTRADLRAALTWLAKRWGA